jgi:hypothetical protein
VRFAVCAVTTRAVVDAKYRQLIYTGGVPVHTTAPPAFLVLRLWGKFEVAEVLAGFEFKFDFCSFGRTAYLGAQFGFVR